MNIRCNHHLDKICLAKSPRLKNMFGSNVRSPLLLCSTFVILFTTFNIHNHLDFFNVGLEQRSDSSACVLEKKLGTENQFPFLELISFPGSGNT